MPLRKAIPLTFRPAGLSDTLDGSNAFAGAMASLQNLVCAPHSANMFVPRSAETEVYGFSEFTTPGVPTAEMIIGLFAWGMVPSSGDKDVPYCVNLLTGQNVPVSGVVAGNCPTTQPTTGDWTPPSMAAFPGRILVTHPGFPSADGSYFGWFDISSFSNTALKGNIAGGSAVIRSIQTPGGTSAPIVSGVSPGQLITGTGIPANTRVVSVTNGTYSKTTTGDFTSGSAVVINIPSTTGFEAGMAVAGVGPATGALILSVDSATQITMTANAISTAAGSALIVTGGGTITMSATATADTNNLALTITGGTPSAPLWAAGNTNTNPLTAVPNCVGQFNGRAWFGVGPYAVFSDALNPTQVTNASQALLLGDSTDVTALKGLPLTSQVSGGVIQSLIAFKGAGPFFQIMGDSATNNLTQSIVNGSVGTLAPNTICALPLGLGFIAPDGFRILGLSGTLSDPIGPHGLGVFAPFSNALYPSRMCAAFGQNTYRVTVQNNAAPAQPFQEYWYDFGPKTWNGPHTFPHALIESCDSLSCFFGAAVGINGKLWQSFTDPTILSTYVENGEAMKWVYQPVLLPDNTQMAMNQMAETTIGLAISIDDTVRVVAYNEFGMALGTAYITGDEVPRTIWGQFTWGQANWTSPAGAGGYLWGQPEWGEFYWGSIQGAFVQYPVSWDAPLVFKQMMLRVTGTSASGQAIGNIYMRYQIAGYQLQGLGA